jgi:hypothetical protein
MARTHAAEERVTYAATSRNNRRAVISVVRSARVATQRCGEHVSASVNRYAIIEEAVFSVGPPRGYITRTYAARSRTELSSGVGSCSRELRESAIECD